MCSFWWSSYLQSCCLICSHRCSIRLRSGDCAGYGSTQILLSSNHCVAFHDVCLGLLSCWKFIHPHPFPISQTLLAVNYLHCGKSLQNLLILVWILQQFIECCEWLQNFRYIHTSHDAIISKLCNHMMCVFKLLHCHKCLQNLNKDQKI